MPEQISNLHLRFSDGEIVEKYARRIHCYLYQGAEYDQSNQTKRARSVRLALRYLNGDMDSTIRKACGL